MNILSDSEKEHMIEYYGCSLYALEGIAAAVVKKLKDRAEATRNCHEHDYLIYNVFEDESDKD